MKPEVHSFIYHLLCFVFLLDVVNVENRRKVAGWTIMLTCIGALVITYTASNVGLNRWVFLMLFLLFT